MLLSFPVLNHLSSSGSTSPGETDNTLGKTHHTAIDRYSPVRLRPVPFSSTVFTVLCTHYRRVGSTRYIRALFRFTRISINESSECMALTRFISYDFEDLDEVPVGPAVILRPRAELKDELTLHLIVSHVFLSRRPLKRLHSPQKDPPPSRLHAAAYDLYLKHRHANGQTPVLCGSSSNASLCD